MILIYLLDKYFLYKSIYGALLYKQSRVLESIKNYYHLSGINVRVAEGKGFSV